jgi:hypothetical protein
MPTKVHLVNGQDRLSDKVKIGDILINTNTFSPSHCGVVTEAIAKTNTFTITHATRNGMKVEGFLNWTEEADMFRMKPGLSDTEAEAIAAVASEIAKFAQYGKTRAVFHSAFASNKVGPGLNKRLEKYRQRLQEHQGVIKNVYCSDLVVLSYQLACGIAVKDHKIEAKGVVDQSNRLFIQLDSKHCWPSTLRTYFMAHKDWEYLGVFKPKL